MLLLSEFVYVDDAKSILLISDAQFGESVALVATHAAQPHADVKYS